MATSESLLQNLLKGIAKRSKKIFKNPYKKFNVNWLSIKYLKHLPANKIHSHKLLDHETFFYGGPEFLHGLKEIFVDDIYDQQLPENAYIIDCGAHIGMSVIYLKSICPNARIVCFEPDQKNYELLKKNISSHQLKTIDARNEAVWNENTSLDFIQEASMGSKIGSNHTANTVSVKAIRLKDYLNERIDFLKLDIEGAEYKVLKDIADNLQLVSKLFIEYHGKFSQNNEMLEIFSIIQNAGFQFYIKEATSVYDQPFLRKTSPVDYDVQLNIFCFRNE